MPSWKLFARTHAYKDRRALSAFIQPHTGRLVACSTPDGHLVTRLGPARRDVMAALRKPSADDPKPAISVLDLL